MRGLIIGYLLGNKRAREWLADKICQASCVIDKELKKTPIWNILLENKDGENDRRKNAE